MFTAILSGAVAYSAVRAQQTIIVPVPADPGIRQVFVYPGGSYLGIQAQEITKENFVGFGLREVHGAAVEKILENSPAARAGLREGDVILKLNGEEISSVRKLARLIGETAPDHQIALTILRGGAECEITATLGKNKVPEFQPGLPGQISAAPMPSVSLISRLPQQPMSLPAGRGAVIADDERAFVFRNNSRQIGISTTPLTKQLASYFGATDGGVLISNVRKNSPAEKAGLKAGDVIVEIEGQKAAETADLVRAFGAKTEGDVTITVIREKSRQTFRITPEVIDNGQPSGFQTMPVTDEAPLTGFPAGRGKIIL